jgi:uncharacterized iron-regulated protein
MLLTGHPLVGRIWDQPNAGFVNDEAAIAEARRSAVVLLGESHDNPDHHRIQLRVLDALSMGGGQRALAMEQFDVEHQAAIDQASGESGVEAEDIVRAGKLDRGWDWSFYRPLVERALARGMPIIAANLSRSAAQRVVKSGLPALGDAGVGLPMEKTWSAGREQIMSELIRAGHCGQAPEDLVRGIVLAQRARDATMAQAIARYAHRHGVVGIVGRGHARRDIGIPVYLDALSSGARVTVFGLVEVEDGVSDPAAYAAREGAAAYDYLWFTARVARKDPCAGLRLDKSPDPAGT